MNILHSTTDVLKYEDMMSCYFPHPSFLNETVRNTLFSFKTQQKNRKNHTTDCSFNFFVAKISNNLYLSTNCIF